ncbi:PPR domain protein [Medicago truncatula]|uniref:PPR domain protein n=1 Tax=Medicago truncatula TaxID=3880 RepID=A0A072V8P2_MEDTR|nr:PPR domain protein [Medicago truncatula]
MTKREDMYAFPWNSLISAYAESDFHVDALAFYVHMVEEGFDSLLFQFFTFFGLIIHHRLKRALFPDLQFSQSAMQKLLDSQQHVAKEVEEIRLKINILNQHVEDLKHHLTSSEAVLETIIQQKAQVLETKAALSAPLGY